jgi:hypothetical protein
MNSLTSKYFVQGDPVIEKFDWNGLSFDFYKMKWWSRIYEYEWLRNCCTEYFKDMNNKSVIDVATGDQHPAMFIFKSLGFSKVVGTDVVLPEKMKYYSFVKDGIQYVVDDILNTKIKEKFDCVACISVLEHLRLDRQKVALSNLINMVSDDGCLILTFDVAETRTITDIKVYEEMLKSSGFYFQNESVEGKTIVTSHTSPIVSSIVRRMHLSCYRLFATRRKLEKG